MVNFLKTILNYDLHPMREWSLRVRKNNRHKQFREICVMVNNLLNLVSGNCKILMLKSKSFF